MNFYIKEFKVSFLLVSFYALLYLLPIGRKLLKQFSVYFEILMTKINPDKGFVLSIFFTFLTAILCSVCLYAFKSEKKRLFYGIIMGITIYPWYTIGFIKKYGFEPISLNDFLLLFKLCIFLAIGSNIVRLTKFKGGE